MLNFWRPKTDSQPSAEPLAEPLQSVFSSYSPVEAHIVGGMLEDNGIKYAVSNEMFAYADSPISNASGGVQVLVRASDAA